MPYRVERTMLKCKCMRACVCVFACVCMYDCVCVCIGRTMLAETKMGNTRTLSYASNTRTHMQRSRLKPKHRAFHTASTWLGWRLYAHTIVELRDSWDLIDSLHQTMRIALDHAVYWNALYILWTTNYTRTHDTYSLLRETRIAFWMSLMTLYQSSLNWHAN